MEQFSERLSARLIEPRRSTAIASPRIPDRTPCHGKHVAYLAQVLMARRARPRHATPRHALAETSLVRIGSLRVRVRAVGCRREGTGDRDRPVACIMSCIAVALRGILSGPPQLLQLLQLTALSSAMMR